MNTVIQSLDSPNLAQKKNPALYCLTLLSLVLIGLTFAAGYQVMELLPLKETVQQQSHELAEGAEVIIKLDEKNRALTSQLQGLEADLVAATHKATEMEALATERQSQNIYGSVIKDGDDGLCAIIAENIRQVESQLMRDDFFRLRDERESEAEAVLEAYEEELNACLSQLAQNRNELIKYDNLSSLKGTDQNEIP